MIVARTGGNLYPDSETSIARTIKDTQRPKSLGDMVTSTQILNQDLKRYQSIAAAIGVSILAHLLILIPLSIGIPRAETHSTRQAPFRLTIDKRVDIRVANLPDPKANQETEETNMTHRQLGPLHGHETKKKKRYSDLFPSLEPRSFEHGIKAEETISPAKANLSPENLTERLAIGRHYGLRGPRTTPEVDRKLDEFASKILIPVLWKSNASEAKASALIRIEATGRVWLESLYGEPMLRALLFNALINKEHIERLRLDLDKARIARYRIILRFLPVNEIPQGLGLSVSAFEDGMVITKLLPPIMRQFPGMPLEDSESRRAKRREQAAIEKLKESAAFLRPITEMELSFGTVAK